MKKSPIILLFVLSLISLASAELCAPTVSLLNQDPYPGVPGDYVKLVFQISGLENPQCGDITFTLGSGYPVSFNPGETGIRTFKKIDYIRKYGTSIQIPYEVRIDENALDGLNDIEVTVRNDNDSPFIKDFTLEVEDVRTDFEVYVKDYDSTLKQLTFEILNTGSQDIEALTIEIPKQENIIVKGSNRIVVGDLDSNEYTTADFEATPSNGQIILNIIYSDSINARRTLSKEVTFDSSYFSGRVSDESKTSTSTYILGALILAVVVYWFLKRRKKKK